MSDADNYVRESIRQWVWSGFYSEDDIQDMIDDILEDDCDEASLRAAVAVEWAAKQAAELAWPEETENDVLDSVFALLQEQGICALGNAGYTLSDGYSDVAEEVAAAQPGHFRGYCFYHGQDVERALAGGGLMIAFGDLQGKPGAELQIAQEVVDALENAGFDVQWNQQANNRIGIPEFVWQRRYQD